LKLLCLEAIVDQLKLYERFSRKTHKRKILKERECDSCLEEKQYYYPKIRNKKNIKTGSSLNGKQDIPTQSYLRFFSFVVEKII
jgi:hypothetical protein